ncbi:ABC transporter ATP-binding protein [Acinetobacter guillouiae]|uniref:ABC transporter ATP-binding protein n=1 Tax=Acinetobacter guillouiae TaxID=106649 RepID=UPI003AF6B35E
MLKTFIQLLGDDAPVFKRYVAMAVCYGLLSGLTTVLLVPIFTHLLNGEVDQAGMWSVVLLVGVVCCWLLRRRIEELGMLVGSALLSTARQRIGNHVASLPVGWFNPENTARLSHVVSQGMMDVAQLPAHLFTPVISGVVAPVIMVIALFFLNVKMGLIALVVLPIIAIVFIVASKLGSKADEAFHRASGYTSQRMVEFAQAQSVLRAFNGEGGSTRFLEQAIDQQKESGTQLIYISTASVVLNSWVVQIIFAALIIVAVLGINQWLGIELSAGYVISTVIALFLVNRFVDPLLDIAGYGEALRGARGQLNAVQEIFAIRPLSEPKISKKPFSSSVEFKNVSFHYEHGTPDVIRKLNLKIQAGSMTALIGASGSGKSTLVSLIARFFDVTDGAVYIGGVDVRDMSSEALSSQISQIFQKTYLFAGSIAENIRVGKPNATDAEVQEAIHLAGVDEIVARLPEGINTPVGEGGARLSGGERQRISIARALIKDAPILLVDEATAALDAENQAAIAETLARLRGKRTLIVIAHQLSTISMSDQIVVLENGHIIENGSHEELRQQDSRYTYFLSQRNMAKGWRIA